MRITKYIHSADLDTSLTKSYKWVLKKNQKVIKPEEKNIKCPYCAMIDILTKSVKIKTALEIIVIKSIPILAKEL